IEIVAYGPGLNMLRADASPVKDRISVMSLENPDLTFAACGNTHRKMSEKAGKDIELVSEAKMVPSGVVRLIELQEAGYAYLRP
ncbi:MAG: DsrE family protein, partial [Hyphomicrobiales bacterium]|nr:DsrE family protein [Hyphomicrobiales bacterium]